MTVDLHNHTPLCNHAVGEPLEFVRCAIKAGTKYFGFSDHAPMNYDEAYRMKFEEMQSYEEEIKRLRDEFSGEIEIDESYFGSKRLRGKRGRGAANKTPVFGMLKRDGKVYTQIVKNCSASELIPILSQYSELDSSTIYSDCWKAYDGLVDYGAKAHYRVKHSKNEFANGKNHINGIENFWGYAKHRLSKFKGIKKENFLLHLKECEFRYNTKTTQEGLYQKLLKLIRENPLKFN